MRLLPQKFFKWPEPKPYLNMQHAREQAEMKGWHRPLTVIAILLFVLISRYLARFIPDRDPPSFWVASALALGLGVFLVYFVPWINSRCPSEVCLLKHHLVRAQGNSIRRIPYADLGGFAFDDVSGPFVILALTHRKRRAPIFIGMPPDLALEPVAKFLVAHGVPCRNPASNPSSGTGDITV